MQQAKKVLLRERYTLGTDVALLFTYILIAVVVMLLLDQTSTTRIMIWAGFVGVTAPLPKIVQSMDISFDRWFRLELVTELIVAIAFGSVTLLALPESQVRQALLCAILTGVLAGASASGSQFRCLHLAYVLPFTTLAIAGYLNSPNGLIPAAVLLCAALGFSLRMAAEHRSVFHDLVDIMVENADLLEKLEWEHDALINANAYLDDQAWTDALTGLANRAAMTRELNERLSHAGTVSSEAPVTLAFIDLNGFKLVNDTWGHRTGDALLVAVARRLQSLVTADEMACRLGGDEFVFISSDIAPRRLGEMLSSAFAEPLRVEDRSIPVRASIGVATTDEHTSAEDLLRFADRALYRHKKGSELGATFKIFDREMRAELTSRREIEADVRPAFDRGEIDAWFQPIVNLATGEIIGAEALARWDHESGVRSAGAFLDVLTEQALLNELTERTFASSQALQDTVEAAGLARPRVSINISPQQVEQLLMRSESVHRLDQLIIEITEEQAIPNPTRVRQILRRVHELGAEVYVDDFGTGYSSLARTASLPIDGLKIDLSFISRITRSVSARAVVSSIVDLADRLDVMVIAEGVESIPQVETLLDLGVTYAQGYYFSPAVPGPQLTKWLLTGERLGEQRAAA